MSSSRVRIIVVGAVVALAIATSGGPSAAASAGELPVWGSVPSPNQGELANTLLGVDGSSPADVWAVGEWNPGVPPTVTGRRTLALHFGGSTWQITETPNVTFAGADLTTLEGVATFAANDAWAVGHGDDFASLKSETFALHWDGIAWTQVATPNPSGADRPNQLLAVDGVAANDIWAVGVTNYPSRALVLHYDGVAWSQVSAPGRSALHGVFALAPDDAWAAGPNLVLHWDGVSWTRVRTPRPRGEFSELSYNYEDVSASGPDDVWLAGTRTIASGEHVTVAPLVLHWDGTRWTRFTTLPGYVYEGVVAVAPDDVWVTGSTSFGQPLIAHFDGQAFTAVPTPDPSGDGGLVEDATAVPGGGLVAVGLQYEYEETSATPRTLVLDAPSATQGQVIGDTNVGFASVAWFGAASGSAETDAFGDFSAGGLPAGDYTFVVSNAGCEPAVADIVVTAGASVTQTFTLNC